ncbi:SMC-Scp complex subunit ScpB [Fervidobacterium thailandense]|uniref:SMC-Scp complex subunit ScpB n=1 Tax=Fervidobacterium thailandense TaxID=1008305 RepID=A0A1E3G151_9BACT|nr:SMC-Scp complex subunit ScpB [Fervidobacterium thailandense]ODN29967.1 hypothetical protein A4H02_07770 [Fervidobacterium thailandense]
MPKSREISNDPSKNKALIEALIFASRGITLEQLAQVSGIDKEEVGRIVEELIEEYKKPIHGVELKEIEGFFRFYTKSDFSDWISKVARKRHLGSLTPAQLEIAIFLAVKKGATKFEIDSMRGRDSANLLRQLLSSGVIKRRKVGRGYVYSLTETFKDESMIEELIRQAGGASFEALLATVNEETTSTNAGESQVRVASDPITESSISNLSEGQTEDRNLEPEEESR